jgi:5'-methylthioadenosine phosphorylase
VTVDAIIQVLLANAASAQGLVAQVAAGAVADQQAMSCGCRSALQHALITAPAHRDPAMVERLRPIAGRVL